uniref:Unkown protein n=1 Tax=Riptortus pedestris TaxID=329032 RepID=R4WE30_RIPPE|nr:unkown protein [Riptortus pedestris]
MAAREEEKKQASRMESIVKNYEKKNQELEEREVEVRYRLQMLENTMPALMMWNMWRMMMAMQGQGVGAGVGVGGYPPSAPIPLASGNPKEEELILKLQALESRLNTENRMLQESRNAEEVLRNKVQDLERLLDSKDTNIMHILDRDALQDVEAFEKLSRMAKERVEMDRRIKDLELKEKMYQETLQQVDGMFADMEGNYTKQLQEKDDALYTKENQLAESEHKLRQASKLSEMNFQLQERLVQLESEMKRLTESLKKREAEREALEKEERRLNQELQDCLRELDVLKQEIEGPMKGQLEVQKKKALYLEEQLDKSQAEKLNLEAEHKNEVSTLKNRINQLNRELMESDVTIGELREEVQTLEMAIDDLRYMMSIEKANKEELKREFEAKIEEKERELEELRESMKSKPPAKSLRDELEEMIGLERDIVSTMVSGMGQDYSEELDVEDVANQQQLHITPNLSSKNPTELSKGDIELLNSKPPEPKQRLRNELKSKTVHEIKSLLKEIDGGEPLLDYESTKGIHDDRPIQSNYLPLDCQIAQDAVNTSSGKNIKGTVDNLTKAFQHSKTCKTCNEALGTFLGDLIKELGVRLPSVNVSIIRFTLVFLSFKSR